MKLQKRLLVLLFAVVTLCTVCTNAYAYEVPDITQRGSITVTMQYQEDAVPGGILTLYRIGDIQESDGNYSFGLTEDFAGYGKPLEDIESGDTAEKIAEYAEKHEVKGSVLQIPEEGQVVFDNLIPGLYLIVQSRASDGFYEIEPFLVTIPMMRDGIYVYDVDAGPKIEPENEGVVDDYSDRRPSILPQTGQLNWPVPVLAMLGLVLFSAGWLLRFGKEKDIYEK